MSINPNQYISDDQYQKILGTLNIEFKADSRDEDQQDLLDRSVGDMESDLCEKYVVPLVTATGDVFSNAPKFTIQKVLNLLRAKIKQNIGYDNARNIVIDSTQKFIDTHQIEYKRHLEAIMDFKRDFGLKLNVQATGAEIPIQKMGIARADNRLRVNENIGENFWNDP